MQYLTPTPEQQAELTALVARNRLNGNGLVIHADNSGGGWQPVSTLLDSKTVFALNTRRDILPLDADTPTAVQGIGVIIEYLGTTNTKFLHLESGGEGREHLFIVKPRRKVADYVRGLARRYGIDIRDNTPIRPPGVPHRSGRLPILKSHNSWGDAITMLQAGFATTGEENLTPRLAKLIKEGDVDGRYLRHDEKTTDYSRLTLAVCNIAITDGVDKLSVINALRDPASKGGHGYRRREAEKGSTTVGRWFEATWLKAQQSVEARLADGACLLPRASGDVDIQSVLQSQLDDYMLLPQKGRQGTTNVAVYKAAIEIAQRHSSRIAPMSVRTLAEISGKTEKPVRSALKRMVEQGLLKLETPGIGDRADVYRVMELPESLQEELHNSHKLFQSSGGCVSTGGLMQTSLSHDGWSEAALGAGCWRTLHLLGDEQTDMKTLAVRTGYHISTIFRHLQKAITAGLVIQAENGFYRLVAMGKTAAIRILDTVAEKRGVAGRGQKRRERWAKERQLLRESLENPETRAYMENARSKRYRAFYRTQTRKTSNYKLAA